VIPFSTFGQVRDDAVRGMAALVPARVYRTARVADATRLAVANLFQSPSSSSWPFGSSPFGSLPFGCTFTQ